MLGVIEAMRGEMTAMNRRMGVMHEVLANLRKEVAGATDDVQEALVSMASNSLGVGVASTPNVVLIDGEVASVHKMLQDSDKDNNMVENECGDRGVTGGEVGSGRRGIYEDQV